MIGKFLKYIFAETAEAHYEIDTNKLHLLETMKETLLDNDEITFELENGILIGTGKSPFLDIHVAIKITNYRLEIQKGKSNPILSNIKMTKNSTKEARDFLASEKGCKGVIAAAILINSDVTSMIANFFMRISRPIVPTKIFTDEAEAKTWLSQYVKKD